MRPTPLAFALALAACSAPQDHTPPLPQPCPTAPAAPSASASASAAPESSPDPSSVANAEGAVKTIASRADIPLSGPRVDGKPGDWLVDNGVAAVVVSQEGRILDYGLRGERDEIAWLNPTIAFGLVSLDTPVKKISAVAGNKALRLERSVAGKPAVLVSWIYLKGASLHVETAAEGTGDDPALAVTLGERVSWGNVPTWMEGHGYITDSAKITGAFLARDSLGVAYALCSENGPLYARFDEQEFAGFFEPGRTGESVVLVPAHGRSAMRSIAVTASKGSIGDAVLAMPCGPSGSRKQIPIQSAVSVPRARLEVVRCGEDNKPGKPFVEYRHVLDKAPLGTLTTRTIELPEGCFRARFTAPGHAPGDWLAPDSMKNFVVDSQLPKAGKLAFSVTEGGKPLPARIVVRGDGATPDPDWGEDADGTGAASNVLATETGSGEVFLPPGKYRVYVNRGFEYTAKEEKIEIKRDKTTTVKAALDRVVDTKGWITADMHLHAVPSSDAPSLLSDRIRSLVAGGIEVAVATDHNAVTDYRPTIGELGLKERITNLIGDEITTRDAPFGHFIAFPFDAATVPFAYKDTTPAAIFAEARTAKPFGKDTIVQVNHPRMGGIGYFDLLRFDPTDIPGWLKRSPLADLSFDAIEIFNGDHYAKINKVEECLSDWYALLNAGYRPTATGNSDSHRVGFHDPGVPRNLVQVPDDDPAKLSDRAFVDAVRAGKVVVSSGPFLTLKIGDKGVGDTVAAGESEIVATVDGPPWVDIDEVMLLKRGEKLEAWKAEKAKGKRPWQFRTKQSLKAGDWVIAIARGKKPMTYLYRPGATPFAFTNPIFVK